MISIIETIFRILLDKSSSIGHKTSIFISLIGIVILLDFGFQFSYDIYISNKLSNLEKIDHLKDVYTNDKLKQSFLISTEKRIFENKHYSEYLSSWIHNLQVEDKQKDTIEKYDEIPKGKDEKRLLVWMFISSNFIILFTFVVLFLIGLFLKKEAKRDMLVGLFATFLIALIFMAMFTWILSFIPLILNRPYLNYLLNFIIQFILVVLPFKFLIRKNTKEQELTNTDNL